MRRVRRLCSEDAVIGCWQLDLCACVSVLVHVHVCLDPGIWFSSRFDSARWDPNFVQIVQLSAANGVRFYVIFQVFGMFWISTFCRLDFVHPDCLGRLPECLFPSCMLLIFRVSEAVAIRTGFDSGHLETAPANFWGANLFPERASESVAKAWVFRGLAVHMFLRSLFAGKCLRVWVVWSSIALAWTCCVRTCEGLIPGHPC